MQPASCHEKIQLSEFMLAFLKYIYIIIECLTGFIPNITSETTESALPIIQVFHFHHIQGARAGRDCSYQAVLQFSSTYRCFKEFVCIRLDFKYLQQAAFTSLDHHFVL